MRKIEIDIIKTEELNKDDIIRINDLKNQHWKYDAAEHMRWFNNNIKEGDLHIILRKENEIDAYLNMVRVLISAQGKTIDGLGVGNVCVSKREEHSGLGIMIMSVANAILKEEGLLGLLLCHRELISFYQRCGWDSRMFDEVIVCDKKFTDDVMIYDPYMKLPKKRLSVSIDRFF